MLVAVVLLAVVLAPGSFAMNHWLVTEEGKIEYQLASPFKLRQPFNLLAFMQQEDRVSTLKELKHDLIEYRNEFEKHTDFQSFDASFRARDPTCRDVKLITLYDLYVSTVLPLEHKGINFLSHLDPSLSSVPGEPFCSSPLPFSMAALEHLEGVQRRRSLIAPPEKSVLASMDMRMEVFGSFVHHALEKNATSWVLLDLASLYWRARGNPYHAVECTRRALHYSPQYAMDIALLNLANVLHRSQHSRDAVSPLRAAIGLAPRVNILHYTLANVYAALNQLNASVKSFKRCLVLDPSSPTVQTAYLAAQCALKLDAASKEHARKLELTEKKLDAFYRNMDLVQQHQAASTSDELLVESGKFLGSSLKPKKKATKASKTFIRSSNVTAAVLQDTTVVGSPSTPHETTPPLHETTPPSNESTPSPDIPPTSESLLRLEKDLDEVIFDKNTSNLNQSTLSQRNEADSSIHWDEVLESSLSDGGGLNATSVGLSEDGSYIDVVNVTADDEGSKVKGQRSKLRLVLLPLSDVESEQDEAPPTECVTCTSHDHVSEEAPVDVCWRYLQRLSPWQPTSSSVCLVDSCEAVNATSNCSDETQQTEERISLDSNDADTNTTGNQSESLRITVDNIEIPPIKPKFSDEEAQKVMPESSREVIDKYTGMSDALHCALGEASQEKCRKASNEYQRKREDQRVRKQLRELIKSDDFPVKLKNKNTNKKNKARPKIIITNEEDNDTVIAEELQEKVAKKVTENTKKKSKTPLKRSITTPDTPKQPDDDSTKNQLQQFARPDYPESYHNLDFLPYNPLPTQLEELIFPDRSVPLADYDDPYWPSKTDCLALVGELRENPHLASFTGTFLTPEARGADLQKLFTALPSPLPSSSSSSSSQQQQRKQPHCTAIVELPYSMAALDHLHPVMYRTTLRANEESGERGLKRVLINAVTGSLTADLSFERSAERVYAAMLKNGPNWALFNIASLYWRVMGDPANAIECLRRAIHFSPNSARDVGYLGLASVLIRSGYLTEAVVAARAALDIAISSPVGHYTMASAYLGLRDYVATSLHLRAALHVQPVFDHAHSALRLVRCSLKFREEQVYLRRKMQQTEEELLRKQEEMILQTLQETVKRGTDGGKFKHTTAPPIVVENTAPPEIPELKMEDMVASPYTGEDAIRYLTKLALLECSRNKLREAERKGNEGLDSSNDTVEGSTDAEMDSVDHQSAQSPNDGVSHSIQTGESNDSTRPNSEPSENQNLDNSAAKSEPKSDQNHDNAVTENETKPDTQPPIIDDSKYDIPVVLHRRSRSREDLRNDVIKKRFPGTRPWPELEECQQKSLPKSVPFTSTLLSVTAKGIIVKEHIDFRTPLEHYPLLPYCHNDFVESKKTLVQLTGMEGHPLVQYQPEKGLQEVLCNLDGKRRKLEDAATRIRLALDRNSTSWVLSNLAALYWRIVGQGQLAVKCLKHALYYCHDKDRDVALVSLANVLYRLGYDKDAAVAVHMSLEVGSQIAPALVVNHFTMANILAAQGLFVEAAGFLESTLHYQPEFEPAAGRLRTVRCILLVARHNKEQKLKAQREKEELEASKVAEG